MTLYRSKTYTKAIEGVLRAKPDGLLRMDCGAAVYSGDFVILHGGGYEARYKVVGYDENGAHRLQFAPRTCMEVARDSARHEPQARAAR